MLNESGENVDLLDTPSQESLDGLEGSDTLVAEPEVPEQQIEPEPTPVAPEFSHPHLQGKTPAEIESLFNLMQNTVQGQVTRINELSRVPAGPPLGEEAPPSAPKGDFFDDPLAHMRVEMARAVAPINEEIANLKAQSVVNRAWEQIGMKFQDFEKIRPHVEVMLQNMNVAPNQVDAPLLESLYYGAKGYIATHEATSAAAPAAPPTADNQPAVPPQHRPSSAPLPRGVSAQRVLTEDERRMAREFGMTAEEWINWGDKDEEDVATAEVSNG